MITQADISKMGPGYFHIPVRDLCRIDGMMQTLIMDECPAPDVVNMTADVKVHMLMPGQYPCIPNWHHDLVPRDGNLDQRWDWASIRHKMWLWVSNEPLTQFVKEDGTPYSIYPQKWYKFTQFDKHRGTMSDSHTWRLFIRLAPVEILPSAPAENWIRRHSQVYLDANNFTW